MPPTAPTSWRALRRVALRRVARRCGAAVRPPVAAALVLGIGLSSPGCAKRPEPDDKPTSAPVTPPTVRAAAQRAAATTTAGLPLAVAPTPTRAGDSDPLAAAGFDPVAGAAHGGLADASPSTSIGTPQDGTLAGGVRLPVEREQALRPLANTERRDLLWGTAELVRLVVDVGRAVAEEAKADGRAAVALRVGNLSQQGGGDIIYSRSHNSGRDADLCFFAKDREGRPVDLERMARYDDTGVAVWPSNVAGAAYFDVERNWRMVRHLLVHPVVVVQWIFVSAPLRNMLLDHALRLGEPEVLRERARRVLVQPTDSRPHDDHFHVRIACPPDDRPSCREGAGRTSLARAAQIDALLHMYHHGSPAEQRYARDILSLPAEGEELVLLPVGEDHEHPEGAEHQGD